MRNSLQRVKNVEIWPFYRNLIINCASLFVSAEVVLRSEALVLVKLSDGPAIPLGAKCLIGGFGERRVEKPKGLTAAAEPGRTSTAIPHAVSLCAPRCSENCRSPKLGAAFSEAQQTKGGTSVFFCFSENILYQDLGAKLMTIFNILKTIKM